MVQYEHFYPKLNQGQLKILARILAQNLEKDAIVLLSGPIGSGKTTWSQFFINYFFPNLKVLSPTFTIRLTYSALASKDELIINHFDFHRINSAHEIFELFADQFSDKINLIEWAPADFPFNDYSKHIYYLNFAYLSKESDFRSVKIGANHCKLSLILPSELG